MYGKAAVGHRRTAGLHSHAACGDVQASVRPHQAIAPDVELLAGSGVSVHVHESESSAARLHTGLGGKRG